MTARLFAISNDNIWNVNLTAVVFPDKRGAVSGEVEKVPWPRQFPQFFGTEVSLQNRIIPKLPTLLTSIKVG